ncbi:MAG: hypothetical protein M1827_004154 [Pycnora praestabilis]|nr:MAG: hypothetical protein M1827_004154 [Pycnora praestabilis]
MRASLQRDASDGNHKDCRIITVDAHEFVSFSLFKATHGGLEIERSGDHAEVDGIIAFLHIEGQCFFLEALEPRICILPPHIPGSNFTTNGTLVRQSTQQRSVTIQLRPNDNIRFSIGCYTFIVDDAGQVEVPSSPIYGDAVAEHGLQPPNGEPQTAKGTKKISESSTGGIAVPSSLHLEPHSGLGSDQETSTPKMQGVAEARVLDTPAIGSRYQDPQMTGEKNKSKIDIPLSAVPEKATGAVPISALPCQRGTPKESSHSSLDLGTASQLQHPSLTTQSGARVEESFPSPGSNHQSRSIVADDVESRGHANADTTGELSISEEDLSDDDYRSPLMNELQDNLPTRAEKLLHMAAPKSQTSFTRSLGSQNSGLEEETRDDTIRVEATKKDAEIQTTQYGAPIEFVVPINKNALKEAHAVSSASSTDQDSRVEDERPTKSLEPVTLASKNVVGHSTPLKTPITKTVESAITNKLSQKRKLPPAKEPGKSGALKKRRRLTVSSDDSTLSTISLRDAAVRPPSLLRQASSAEETRWALKADSVTASQESTSPRQGSQVVKTKDQSPLEYNGPAPRIVFSNSNIPQRANLMKFLRKHKCEVVDNVSEQGANFLCVGKGALKRTGKLILSVCFGKNIVSDDWIVESSRAGCLLDPGQYLPSDPGAETQWHFSLQAAIERGKQRLRVFEGWNLHFTPALKRENESAFDELKQIALGAGANTVVAKLPREKAKELNKTLIFASEDDIGLEPLLDGGWAVHSKELISSSILRGTLEVSNDEFKVSSHLSNDVGNSKKKSR